MKLTEPITELLTKDLTSEYTETFAALVDSAFEDLTQLPIEQRLSVVDEAIERYLTETGEKPQPKELDRLAHVLAWDYMEGDTRSNKSRTEGYPILTDAQYARRTSGENFKTSHFETSREVYVDISYLASDGRDYRPPVRRYE